MIELTVMVFITTLMERSMRENGLKINNMEKVLKLGLTEQSIKAPTKKEKKKDKESLFGVIWQPTRETLVITTFMVIFQLKIQ